MPASNDQRTATIPPEMASSLLEQVGRTVPINDEYCRVDSIEQDDDGSWRLTATTMFLTVGGPYPGRPVLRPDAGGTFVLFPNDDGTYAQYSIDPARDHVLVFDQICTADEFEPIDPAPAPAGPVPADR